MGRYCCIPVIIVSKEGDVSNDLILACCGLKRHQAGCRSAVRAGWHGVSDRVLTRTGARWKTEHGGDPQLRVLFDPSGKCWVLQPQAVWLLCSHWASINTKGVISS